MKAIILVIIFIALAVSLQAAFDVATAHTLKQYPSYTLFTRSIASLGIESPYIGQYAGYFKCDLTQQNIFYWFFESRSNPATDPLILWLTGGPGCSSSYGLFFELGPSSINTEVKPVHNPWSWNSNASVIFLDQPTYTGFSYGGIPALNTDTATQSIYMFIEFFLDRFPQFRKVKFHIAGESYSGHYIPNLVSTFKRNSRTITFNLTSVLIGNGIIDPLTQIGAYRPMACGEGGYKKLLNSSECQYMEEKYQVFKKIDELCYKYGEVSSCVYARRLGKEVGAPFSRLGLNPYDIRKECVANTSDCYVESQPIDQYLNLANVKQALGVPEATEFQMCKDSVAFPFEVYGDNMRPSQQYLQNLLEDDIPVLIYSGDKDFVCSWVGLLQVCDKLNYKQFEQQQLRPWRTKSGGAIAGEVKNYDKLTFVRVYDAGHMVPFDQPEASLDLVNRWINGDLAFE
ncbi:hypothetical protein CANMA_000446 [Candida margitis]|uniref:uncharacterized protein n=1 Tax=Candida margitis TaxID=1775924 RepID=UPI002228005A|nr:uncharacterized protein CANMA_000446 [Candida margitis]KAI5970537.1 hypothetical protein CANMA_000446 [Candida margitis]